MAGSASRARGPVRVRLGRAGARGPLACSAWRAREDLGGGPLAAADRSLHQPGPVAGGVLACEVQPAGRAGQQLVVARVAVRGAGRIGGAHPRVVVPGRQHHAVLVEVEVGPQRPQPAEPAGWALGDAEPLERRRRARERAHHRLHGPVGAARGPGPVVVGDRQDRAGWGWPPQGYEQLGRVPVDDPPERPRLPGRQGRVEAAAAGHRRRHRAHGRVGGHHAPTGPGPHARPGPGHRLDGDAEPDRRAEPLGHAGRDELVAAGHPHALGPVERRAGMVERGRGERAERLGGRDLDAGRDRLARARVERQGLEQRRGREAGGPLRPLCQQPPEPGHLGPQGLAGHAEPAPGLAVAIAHAGRRKAEAEAGGGAGQRPVLPLDELSAQLDDGAVGEPGRVDAPAHPLARLEHDRLGAPLLKGPSRREPGEARPDDAHPHGPILARPRGPGVTASVSSPITRLILDTSWRLPRSGRRQARGGSPGPDCGGQVGGSWKVTVTLVKPSEPSMPSSIARVFASALATSPISTAADPSLAVASWYSSRSLVGLSESTDPSRSTTPRSREATKLRSGSMRALVSRAWGRVTATDRRSSETLIAPLPTPEKSTSASTLPAATNSVRSPLRNDGRYFESFSRSIRTWKLPEAAL